MSRPASRRQIQPPGGSRGGRRGGAGGSHQDTTTPEPVWSDKLAFKKGDVVRVMPQCGMPPEFPEGQVVIITDYEPTKTSPTVYADQKYEATDAFTVYSFKKLVPDQRFTYHEGPLTGGLGAPVHTQLSLTPHPGSISEVAYTVNQKVYLQTDINISYRPSNTSRAVALRAGANGLPVRCFIAQETTYKDSRLNSVVTHHTQRSVQKSFYVIKVKVSEPYWREVKSMFRKEGSNFEKLSSLEAQSYFSQQNLPYQGVPTVISVSENDVLLG